MIYEACARGGDEYRSQSQPLRGQVVWLSVRHECRTAEAQVSTAQQVRRLGQGRVLSLARDWAELTRCVSGLVLLGANL